MFRTSSEMNATLHQRKPVGRLPRAPWPFDADGRAFQLALEAYRIRSAYLFDPYSALHTSQIEPLPHQIAAVYDEMLTRRPLRFLLADDPGAGKTVMAGLLLKELKARGDLKRCLIVVPGNLVAQWRWELSAKFGLSFAVFDGSEPEARAGNPFDRHPFLLARMDTLSRNAKHQALLKTAAAWDLVICDEAHRMSASYYGAEVRKTKRYRLGEALAARCRDFLLMTATPHNGKEEDFQLFMALLDPDRFAGKFRSGVHRAEARDLMRRLTKEELLRFDGTPLFPERRAYTARFALSPAETALYEAVTHYVRAEMNRAERIGERQGNRQQTVGFALQLLQRRLASSPAAIHKSLQRRRQRLQQRLPQIERGASSRSEAAFRALADPSAVFTPEWLEDAPDEEIAHAEEQVLDRATAATTASELRAEIQTLSRLEEQARTLLRSGRDAKWLQLNSILDDPRAMGADQGRKLIVFTEARDTLTYLAQRIRTRLGRPEAVVEIHGGLSRRERQRAVTRFTQDADACILVANDAAGEGINLQCAHLMVNYDLPWNPNRLEQRFGRIHRIGQTQVCHLWNLVAQGTREGDVYARLLEKLEQARATLGGRVYDVLGLALDARQLRELMVDAIRYGNQARFQARMAQASACVSEARLREILAAQAAPHPAPDAVRVADIADAKQQAEAVRLQPYNMQAFFLEALPHMGGQIYERERGRWEITHVPQSLREAQAKAGERNGARRYARVCFDKAHADGAKPAALLCPGHTLFDAAVAAVLARNRSLLRRGTMLVDPTAEAYNDPVRAIFFIEHSVQDGQGRAVSQCIRFVEVDQDHACRDMGPSPILDLRPLRPAEYARVQATLENDWIGTDLEAAALAHARAHIASAHLRDLRARRAERLDAIAHAVRFRLAQEINHWDHQAAQAKEQERAGRTPAIGSADARRQADELAARRRQRDEEFKAARDLVASAPRVAGGALVIPQGWLAAHPAQTLGRNLDARSRRAVERLAMQAVMEAERALGYQPHDVSAQKLGYDVRSHGHNAVSSRFIEVKGRAFDALDVTVTANEIKTALNVPQQFILAIVRVKDGQAERPQYVRQPFLSSPDPALKSSSFSLKELLKKATHPC